MIKELRRPLYLIVLGIFMIFMPISEEPHFYQKINLLVNGWLNKPMDIFDLLLHGGPLLIGIIYFAYNLNKLIAVKK